MKRLSGLGGVVRESTRVAGYTRAFWHDRQVSHRVGRSSKTANVQCALTCGPCSRREARVALLIVHRVEGTKAR